MYLAFFVIVGGAAFGLIQTTTAPEVSLDRGQTFGNGDSVTLGDRTYDVSVSDSGGELAWSNESAVVQTSLENGSTVPPSDVVWADQSARMEQTLQAGGNVSYNGTQYDVSVNASAGTVTLTNPDDPADNVTVEQGNTFAYRGFDATVTAVSGDGATVVWGFPYVVDVFAEGEADPTTAAFVEQRDLTQLAVQDPAIYGEINVVNGTRVVTYRANETNVPVEEYFDPAERHNVTEGETLAYQGNESTIVAVTNTSIELERPTTRTESISLSEGENVTVGGEQYFAHFTDDSTVMILDTGDRYADYRAEENRVASYDERVLGLWGVAELSVVAIIVLLATAFLPVRG